jgi:hypothetical protein
LAEKTCSKLHLCGKNEAKGVPPREKKKKKKPHKFECTNPTPMLINFPSEYNFTGNRIRKPKLKKAG